MPGIRRWSRASAARWLPRSSASATGGETMKVGVIGLGTMGMGAALNLVRKGHQVTGCDVREAARTELAAAGSDVIARAADLPADTEAVLVFVVNASQTEEVLFGVQGCLSKLTKGGVILC